MDIENLKERIQKKESDIAKIEKRISKWEGAKSVEGYIKEGARWYPINPKETKTLDQLKRALKVNRGISDKEADERVERGLQNHYQNCDWEIKRAKRDLSEAEETLQKYKNQLTALEVKINSLQNDRIQIIWDFLEQWKEKVLDYYLKVQWELVKEYYELSRQLDKAYNERNKELIAELREKRIQVRSNIDPLAFSTMNSRGINQDELLKALNEEEERKYFALIDQVTKYTGDIQDISNLRIGGKGDLNGFVTGSKGKASVQTVGAGGYNIQCYHFRTYVKPY